MINLNHLKVTCEGQVHDTIVLIYSRRDFNESYMCNRKSIDHFYKFVSRVSF